MQDMDLELRRREEAIRQQTIEKNKINRQAYIMVIALFLLLIITAFIFGNPHELYSGFVNIITSPSNLTTDYFVVGGPGASLLNAALLLLLSTLLVRVLDLDMSGSIIAALFLVAGFALFGKNLYNSAPITAGVFLYSRAIRVPLSNNILPAIYGTALGPFVSIVTFDLGLPLWQGITAGVIVGLIIGFVIPPLAASFVRFHAGFNLYNVGFAAGIVGMFGIGILRAFGYHIENVSVIYEGPTPILNTMVMVTWILFIVVGIVLMIRSHQSFESFRNLTKNSGRLVADFINLYGFEATLINMGLMGIISTSYVILINGNLTGPAFGGILTVVGFSAFGKHILNAPPVMLGVFLASLVTGGGPATNAALLGALFGTALSPISGHYGPLAGIIAGFSHYAMVVNVGYLHGGVNLYNNGFSAGFVAATIVPIFDTIKTIKEARIDAKRINGGR